MANQRHFLRGLALSAILATPLAAQDVNIDTVVATVAGKDVTMAHVMNIRRQLPEQYQSLQDDVLFKGIVDQLVQQSVLADSVAEKPSWLTSAIENEERNLLAQVAMENLATAAISPQAVESAYKERFADFEESREFNASHILVETLEEAVALGEELAAGADFAELAKEHSTGPSGPSGGALGWFGPGMMVAAFEDAVLTLDAGEVSSPVETQFGWHLVKLNDTKMRSAPALEDIRSDLEQQLQSEALKGQLDTLMETAAITRLDADIDPSILSTLQLSGN